MLEKAKQDAVTAAPGARCFRGRDDVMRVLYGKVAEKLTYVKG